MDDIEILEKLSKRVIDYMQNDLGMLNITEEFSIESVDMIQCNNITTLIALNGKIIGTVGMSISTELAKKLIENSIYGEIDTQTIESLASENVAETLNIVLGNIIKDLTIVKNGGKVDISTPFTIHNEVSITRKKNGKMYVSNIKYENENIILSYFI